MTDRNLQQKCLFFDKLAEPAALLKLFDFAPGMYLYVKDIDGRFVAINQALVSMRRARSEDELLGKTDLDIHPAYWGERYRREDRRVMESGCPIVNQVWLVPDAEGHLGTFISSKIPLRDEHGNCIGIAGVMHRIEANETRFSTRPLEKATQLVATRYFENLTVIDIAEASGLSTSQLNRRFKSIYQMSPSQYLQRVRVHEASRLLGETDLAMSEIALRTGFYDQAHLTRTFRKWMDMSPRKFRQISLQGQFHDDR